MSFPEEKDMESSWAKHLKEEWTAPYMKELRDFLEREKASGCIIYPPQEQIFSAFKLTPYEDVKVVIIGQDPYHGHGQAHGLSFSVPEGVSTPPSLRNIFKELHSDLQIPIPKTANLASWAKQGVFLLNATLTVRAGAPKSHYGRGWERFTDAVIDKLLERKDPIVFLLWGSSAQEKGKRIMGSSIHKVFTAAHPSPYSAPRFLGCKHFSKANECLSAWGKSPIDWSL
jgi:uracil-DNA glycosylase